MHQVAEPCDFTLFLPEIRNSKIENKSNNSMLLLWNKIHVHSLRIITSIKGTP